MMGTVLGWQLWWAVDSILVLLGATAVANLYAQGGMSLRLVSWFGLGIGAYDAFFISSLPLTNKLTEKFLGFPLDPSLGMRVGLYNFSLGIGDVLVFSMFLIACYKAYGVPAARLALALIVVFGTVAPSLAPLVINFVDARTDLIVPAQTFSARPPSSPTSGYGGATGVSAPPASTWPALMPRRRRRGASHVGLRRR